VRFIQGRLGDPTETYPWFTILQERIFVGEVIYTVQAFLRGFQVTHANKEDHEVREFKVVLTGFTSVANPGFYVVKAELRMGDDHPAGGTFVGSDDVTFVVDYTIMVA
jgi:hypothetical protein